MSNSAESQGQWHEDEFVPPNESPELVRDTIDAPQDPLGGDPHDRAEEEDAEDEIARALGALGVSLEQIEMQTMSLTTEPLFEEHPCAVTVDHALNTLNRKIDAVFGTDVFRVSGKVQVPSDNIERYTRIFEPVGDWRPNLLLAQSNANIWLVPTKVSRVKTGFTVIHPNSPRSQEYAYYRLVNGKLSRMSLGGQNLDMFPVFVNFQSVPEFGNVNVFGVLESVPNEKLMSSSSVRDTPMTIPELFSEACARAKAQQRSPAALQLVPYVMPTMEQLGNSEDARVYVGAFYPYEALLTPAVSATYKDVLGEMVGRVSEALQQHFDLAKPSDKDDSFIRTWESWTRSYEQETSEEDARQIYEKILDKLSGGKLDTEAFGMQTQMYLNPTYTFPTTVCPEIHLNGVPRFPAVEITGELKLMPGYYFVPEGSSSGLSSTLAHVPELIQKHGLVVRWGRYILSSELQCVSTTPRSQGDSNFLWREKLQCVLDYEGPIFGQSETSRDLRGEKYAVCLNTSFCEETIRRGLKPQRLQLIRPAPGQKLPERDPSPYIEGIGLVRGQAYLSPLAKEVKWTDHFRFDLRLQIPDGLLRCLLAHPKRIRLVEGAAFLDNAAPLSIELNCQEGSRTLVYNEAMKFNFKTQKLDEMVSDHGKPLIQKETQPHEEEEFVPPTSSNKKSKKSAPASVSSVGTSSGQKSKPKAAASAGQNEYPPYDANAPVANRQHPIKVGDWKSLHGFLARKGQSLNNFYRMYTVHWIAANNAGETHPVVNCHNPRWTTSLKDTPPNDEWYLEEEIRRTLRPYALLNTDNEGREHLFGAVLQDHMKAKQKGEKPGAPTAPPGFYGPPPPVGMQPAWGPPSYAYGSGGGYGAYPPGVGYGFPAPRGRGGRGRGRGIASYLGNGNAGGEGPTYS